MTKPALRLLLGSACFCFSVVCMAEEDDKKLKADAEAGFLVTSGNTDSTALKAKLDIKQDFEKWHNNYVFEGLYKENEVEIIENGETTKESQVTAEKYFGSLQTDFKLNKKHRGLFAFVSYEVDEFSGYDYQSTIAVGYADRLFSTENSHLDYSLGPGLSISQEEDTVENGVTVEEGEKQESAVLRIAGAYVYKFSEHAKFTQTVSSDIALESDRNTKTRSETAFTTQLSNAFSLRAAYTISHNSEVPEDRENMDSQTSITLVYSY